MFVEQRLATCEVCSCSLAVEYEWSDSSQASARVRLRLFTCPTCGHANSMLVPYAAYRFVVKPLPQVTLPRASASQYSPTLW